MKTETMLSKKVLLSVALFGFVLVTPALAQDEAAVEIRVSAIVEGTLVSSRVQPGEQVKKSQVMMELDSREHELQLQIAKAQAQAAEGGIMVRQAELEAAKTRLKLAKLPGTSKTGLKTAELAMKVAEGNLRKAEASRAAAQTEVDLRHLYLQRCRIVAPISGKVKKVTARMGEFVSKKQVVVVIERDDS